MRDRVRPAAAKAGIEVNSIVMWPICAMDPFLEACQMIDDLQRLLQPLVGYVPQTYGDAIRAGWIEHGDCPPHEWDNRTSAGNARWMLERLLAPRSGGRLDG